MSRSYADYETGVVQHPTGRRKGPAQLEADFFAPIVNTPTKDVRHMVRANPSPESVRGAIDVLGKLTGIQKQILQALAEAGSQGMTDRDLENMTIFRGYGASTVRKRRSELLQAGKVKKIGRRDKLSVWTVAP